MPQTHETLLTLPNDLTAWVKPFSEIGISEDLLREVFAEIPPASFFSLYQASFRLKNYSNILSYNRKCCIDAAWQLIYLSGDIDRIKKYPDVGSVRDNQGADPLHYAAMSGSVDAITYVLSCYPALAESKDNDGGNLLLCAAWSGSVDAIDTVFSRYPALAESKTDTGLNLLHVVARLGSVDAIAYVLSRYPALAESKTNDGGNLLHCAAWSGSVDAIDTVLSRYPALAESKDNIGRNLLHVIALSGSVDAIAYVLRHYPALAESKTNTGLNLLLCAACSGSVDAIAYVLSRYPALAESKDNTGLNLLHCAAWSGSVDAIDTVLSRYPALAESKTNTGRNLLHSAAFSGSVDAIEFVVTKNPGPKIAVRLWKKDKNGDTPDTYWARNKPAVSLRDIKYQLLKEATQRLLTSESSAEKDIELLKAFQHDWQTLLTSDESLVLREGDIQTLLGNPELPHALLKILSTQQPLLILKSIETDKVWLTKVLLRELVNRAGDVFNRMPRGFFKSMPESMFLRNLLMYGKNLLASESDEMTENSLIALSVIIDDYQRAPNNPDTQTVDALLASKLLQTSSMSALRPQATVSEGRDITPATYAKHFDTLKETFHTLHLSDDTQRIIRDSMLPGLEHIIEHEDKIVQHVMNNFSVLYYVAKDLPLHTDHVGPSDEKAYRQLLQRLVENIFGAFYICQEAGKLTEFFDQLTQGYCLEGCTRSVLSWAAKFSEIKPFDDFMGERVKEYLAYQEHMFHEKEEEAADIDKAVKFILSRYEDFPCQPHDEYAAEGNVTEKGVRRYLENILCYEKQGLAGKQEVTNERCVIS